MMMRQKIRTAAALCTDVGVLYRRVHRYSWSYLLMRDRVLQTGFYSQILSGCSKWQNCAVRYGNSDKEYHTFLQNALIMPLNGTQFHTMICARQNIIFRIAPVLPGKRKKNGRKRNLGSGRSCLGRTDVKKGAGIFETRNVGQISSPVYRTLYQQFIATPLDIAPFQAAEFSDAKTGVHTEKKPKKNRCAEKAGAGSGYSTPRI